MKFQSVSRSFFLSIFALFFLQATYAERVFRTEFAPYLNRNEAAIDARRTKQNYIALKPESGVKTESEDGFAIQEHIHIVDLPMVWTEGSVFMHLENIKDAYYLLINGEQVDHVHDHLSPYEFYTYF